MFRFPADGETFRRSFLEGRGTLEVGSDDWMEPLKLNRPFLPKDKKVAAIKLGGTGPALKLGGKDTVQLELKQSAGLESAIELFWPTEQNYKTNCRELPAKDGMIAARVLLKTTVNASASAAKIPAGPLTAKAGAAAEGHCGLERIKLYPADCTAIDLLQDLLGDLRLPHQVSTVGEIPGPDEVIAATLGGYLKLTGQVSYGYSLTGKEKLTTAPLPLQLDYALRLSASLSASYRIAGDFDLTVRQGSRPNFARFVVSKSADSKFDCAADFGFEAKMDLRGLPGGPDEFLAKLIGAEIQPLLTALQKARKFSSLSELEKEAGKLAVAAAQEGSHALIGAALSDANVQQFVNAALKAADLYNSVDSRICHLFEDHCENVPALEIALRVLVTATEAESLRGITETHAWAVINRLAGERQLEMMVDPAVFADVHSLVVKAHDFVNGSEQKKVRGLVTTWKKSFALDPLLSKLKGIKSADDLAGLADKKLQGLIEKILAKPFAEIRASKPGQWATQLHDALEKIEAFKRTYYEKLTELTHRSLRASLNLAFSASTHQEALVDIELDLSTPDGSALAHQVTVGDFSEALRQANRPHVRLNRGALTHKSVSSTHVQFNLFGYSAETLTTLTQNAAEALETCEGGVMHVYTTKTSLEEKKKRGNELTSSTFLLATAAEGIAAPGQSSPTAATLSRMSVDYRLLKQDGATSAEELMEILNLAESLGVISSAQTFSTALSNEFPEGLGAVKADYLARFEPSAAILPFAMNDDAKHSTMAALARQTMRQFIAARYNAMEANAWLRSLGHAYLDQRNYEQFRMIGNRSEFVRAPLAPPDLTEPAKHALFTLYSVEDKYIKRLVQLDESIDQLRAGKGKAADLDKYARDFVSMADDLDDFGRENAFFVVYDRLVHEANAGQAKRKSALVLEIGDGADKVTKYLSSPARN